MTTQLELFDLIAQETKPLLQIGQAVYIVELDRVKRVELSDNMWLVSLKGRKPYYGYGYKGGVIYDKDLGVKIFLDEESALERAGRVKYDKVYPGLDSLAVTEWAAYAYTRKLDGHKLTAVVAKCGELSMYEKDFVCYSFIKRFKSQKERDKQYAKLLDKIRDESERSGGAELDTPEFESPLYKVDDVYASHGFALCRTD